MTPAETAAQLRFAADWIEKTMPEKPDPYIELKKAHAEGKVIQKRSRQYGVGCPPWDEWLDNPNPSWSLSNNVEYRIKPDEIPWIEWRGGECPLKNEEVEEWEYRLRDGSLIPSHLDVKPSGLSWKHYKYGSDIIAYRVLKWREKKPKVPLGPNDVPPGSAIYEAGWPKSTWEFVTGIELRGVRYGSLSSKYVDFDELQKKDYQINRSIPMTGKWNPDAWEACEK